MEVCESPSEEPSDDYHGVLRYRRESGWIPIIPHQSTSDYTIWCDYCGERENPPLDLLSSPNDEEFCCTEYKELFRNVEEQWRLLKERANEVSLDESSLEKLREHLELQKAAAECLKKARTLSLKKENEMPGCKVTTSGLFTIINFRLTDFVQWKEKQNLPPRLYVIKEEKPEPPKLYSTDSLLPPGFGLCHNQGYVQKFYSNGDRFLTALPDGTTQVFYPSGNLAIITFIDDTVGVCIILDDIKPNCSIRALLLSSGIATCYHSNGSLWLHVDIWGGRIHNETRSRERKWKWMDDAKKPTPFKPLQISLNKYIGVRVRGRDSNLVTFLALGQQAHFNLGSDIQTSEPAPSLCKEEMIAKVSQFNARLALERVRWCLSSYWDSRCRVPKLPRGLVSQARRLLKLSSSVSMEERDLAYIQQCLQDCH